MRADGAHRRGIRARDHHVGALPRWTGALAYVVAVLNAIAVGTIFGGGTSDDQFGSVGGWGTAALATFPWLVWVVCVGIVVIRGRRQHHESAKAIAPSRSS